MGLLFQLVVPIDFSLEKWIDLVGFFLELETCYLAVVAFLDGNLLLSEFPHHIFAVIDSLGEFLFVGR